MLFVVFVTEKAEACSVNGKSVFCARSLKVLPVIRRGAKGRRSSVPLASIDPHIKKLSRDIKDTLAQFQLYFSYEMNITQRLQAQTAEVWREAQRDD